MSFFGLVRLIAFFFDLLVAVGVLVSSICAEEVLMFTLFTLCSSVSYSYFVVCEKSRPKLLALHAVGGVHV